MVEGRGLVVKLERGNLEGAFNYKWNMALALKFLSSGIVNLVPSQRCRVPASIALALLSGAAGSWCPIRSGGHHVDLEETLQHVPKSVELWE